MMICYKFPDRATFLSLSTDKVVEGELVCYTHVYSIHEIGSVVRDEDTIIEGHHVNYVGEPPTDWESYRLRYVDHPCTVFAGTTAEMEPEEGQEV